MGKYDSKSYREIKCKDAPFCDGVQPFVDWPEAVEIQGSKKM